MVNYFLYSNFLINFLISAYFGWKLRAIGYSGILWTFVTFFGGVVGWPLATSLPNRKVELLRAREIALLDQQLLHASLPVSEGEAPIPRTTISDDLTRGEATQVDERQSRLVRRSTD